MPKVIRVEIEYDNGDVYRAGNPELVVSRLAGTAWGQLEKVEKPRMMTNPHDPEIQPHLEMPECKEVGCVEVKP
jgi:hypothetical protein